MDTIFPIRKSKRAKYLQLQFTREKGLEIVVPYRLKYYCLDRFLASQHGFIQKMLAQQITLPKAIIAPHTIALPALDEIWQVSYEAITQQKIRVRELAPQQLHISGPIDEFQRVQKNLKNWLNRYAKKHLSHQLAAISKAYGLPYQTVHIRAQKRRWGSCDSKGNIILNCHLLFLPPQLVKHILLHELCHTQHLNHSPAFWRLLTQFDPDTPLHRKLAREAEHFLPDWI